MSTRKRYEAAISTYLYFCLSFNVPANFRWESLSQFACCYLHYFDIQSFNTGYWGAFAYYARLWNVYWVGDDPATAEHEPWLWCQLKSAFAARDPDRKKDTPVLTLQRVTMMLAELNIASVDDLETCSLYQLQRAALILASHSGGFRFCEVRGGGRISNVSVFAKQVVIDIATTYSAKKLKKKPKRTTHHVWFNEHNNAACVLRAYFRRVHPNAQPNDMLWPRISAGRPNHVDRRRPIAETSYRALLKALALATDLSSEEALRVTPHSLRAGACTDLLAMGCPRPFIARQCGWSQDSKVLYRYHRPARADVALAMAYPIGKLLMQALRSSQAEDAISALPGETLPIPKPFTA